MLSKKRIVEYALQVLLLCQNFGQGGWTHIDGNEEWIVIVSGRLETRMMANETDGVGGDGPSFESREQ